MEHEILVLDDEIEICTILSDTFAPFVKTVHIANSVEAAIKIVDSHDIHLILSDINMPGASGIDFLSLMRQRRFRYPIVLVTANNSEEAMMKALEYGVTDFISKPFNDVELSTTVQRILKIVTELAH